MSYGRSNGNNRISTAVDAGAALPVFVGVQAIESAVAYETEYGPVQSRPEVGR